MTSDFKKIIIVIAVVFILALSFWVGVVFFAKDNGITKTTDNQQEKEQMNDYDKKPEIIEEKKIKSFAEIFTMIYYSYAWGNFSNIESQYYYMTDEMKNREEIKVERIKKETENQPLIFMGISNIPQKVDIIYIEQNEAEIEIECEQYEIEGASIYMNDILTGIDKFGKKSSIHPVYRKTENRKIVLKLLKIDGEWKVNETKNTRN